MTTPVSEKYNNLFNMMLVVLWVPAKPPWVTSSGKMCGIQCHMRNRNNTDDYMPSNPYISWPELNLLKWGKRIRMMGNQTFIKNFFSIWRLSNEVMLIYVDFLWFTFKSLEPDSWFRMYHRGGNPMNLTTWNVWIKFQ